MTFSVRSAVEISSLAGAVLVVGISYGALAVQAGFPPWLTVALALTVLAASAELLFVGGLLAEASPMVAALGALVVNLRNGLYGFAASRYLGSGWTRLAGAHLVNDETVAYASRADGLSAQRKAFWGMGGAVLCAWPLGAGLGTVLGNVADPAVLGLDAVFPTVLLVMLLGKLRDRRTTVTVAGGVVIAAAAVPLVPGGVAPMVGLAALALLLLPAGGRHGGR
ncbi:MULTISPECIES: AzlC family ABC transporter permease [Arthrobacter]|uniref:AzlC family ABC transporter permease n=1 Tax=Arthrobacter caoxuetaonis TaxID=2886935 RepID=A0A9X1MAH7_9MICC|nr:MULTISPECIES: AzlC family ABC transporter permease [Arthrobacter]MCC3281353.1 AzlC family ABC transporter permease [Arthrobacter caoxuetaonis]MCC3296394.1 AzlC family ABC transporter permease [Arthrobacter caoxuetaonis]MCC9192470.1 AzlC family ABC transporter permease [Arthrobacter sp. zg-Y916]USQ56765.1 AzlC family ABC transporter permease [Arthrobacter caoxuetaonis]